MISSYFSFGISLSYLTDINPNFYRAVTISAGIVPFVLLTTLEAILNSILQSDTYGGGSVVSIITAVAFGIAVTATSIPLAIGVRNLRFHVLKWIEMTGEPKKKDSLQAMLNRLWSVNIYIFFSPLISASLILREFTFSDVVKYKSSVYHLLLSIPEIGCTALLLIIFGSLYEASEKTSRSYNLFATEGNNVVILKGNSDTGFYVNNIEIEESSLQQSGENILQTSTTITTTVTTKINGQSLNENNTKKTDYEKKKQKKIVAIQKELIFSHQVARFW